MSIRTETADGVLTLTFDRLDRKNAITAAMYQTLADALVAAETDPAIRVIVLAGHESVFTAGNDLEDFMKNPPKDESAPVHQFLKAISTASKPLIASVSGAAVGVGTTMLLHCDLVYASETAKLSMPFAQLGLCPEAASSLLLPQLAGYHRAADKLLFGEPFDANEARELGLVNRVLPAGELDAFVRTQARKLTLLPPASLRATKRLMKEGATPQIAERMSVEGKQFGEMLRAPEAREAFTAFFEKRRPDFSKFN
ncbi:MULTISPECIES: enoyl-CoA hydratase [Ralstonia]|jgi:enoyl-CoA hydratase/carnithine racemase|uniref:Enoyl-CoA hydratase/carnithine racemase n=1 Tax=Ralstonia pickettii OR214 TaxID=1264675 RepID=R0DRU3_RALPI|nr:MULTISPECIES: enoyl-CoA hydratase [Ralstonia]MEA3270809.1 enoyl-CoA hydratase [Pseudomonadota bacterium]ENZ76193.1 enoyl-CoA hydratase/carnithine racemase [Ralstonia pickettii OR214]MBL4780066.1 enoyl-CoA hydratase [Ralstonia sp.]MCM3582921.1 enoyl-CoA hydratase [Ralstonia pickettii]OYU21526.1 MAG: enoyl-CoA hydratase [Ralstonia sp. PBBBR1]